MAKCEDRINIKVSTLAVFVFQKRFFFFIFCIIWKNILFSIKHFLLKLMVILHYFLKNILIDKATKYYRKKLYCHNYQIDAICYGKYSVRIFTFFGNFSLIRNNYMCYSLFAIDHCTVSIIYSSLTKRVEVA